MTIKYFIVVQFKTQAKEKFVEEEAKLLAPLEQVCIAFLWNCIGNRSVASQSAF